MVHSHGFLLFLKSQERPEQDHKYCGQSYVDQDVVDDERHRDLCRHTDSTLEVIPNLCKRVCERHSSDASEPEYNDSDRNQPQPVLSAPLQPIPDSMCSLHKEELDQHLAADIEDQADVDGCTA